MTPSRLIHALAAELRAALKNYRMIAENEPEKRVKVYEQNIPAGDFETDSLYPFACIEFLNLEDTDEKAVASVLITVGVYTGARADKQTDLLNLSETIRQYLLGHRIIGEQFVLELPAYFAVVEERSENFTFANLFFSYQMPQLITSVAEATGDFFV